MIDPLRANFPINSAAVQASCVLRSDSRRYWKRSATCPTRVHRT
ncbi:hypothetical protein ABZS68_39615 [Streptomyces sp. NPDC005571]